MQLKNPAPSSEKQNVAAPLLWLLPLLLCWRVLFLLWAHPNYLFIYPDEELYRGLFAQDILQGLNLPLIDYRPDNFAGGFFIVSLITSAFFGLLGPTLFALKLTPLLFSSLGLLCWYFLLAQTINRKTAVIFSVLFIFAPTDFVQYSFAALGDHAETIPLTALTLLLSFHLLRRSPMNYLGLFAVGLLAGVSSWFSYTYGLTLITLLFFIFVFHRKILTKQFFVSSLPGFIIGFSPWILFNLQHRFSGFMIRDESLWSLFQIGNLSSLFSVGKGTLLNKLAASFGPHHLDNASIRVALYSYIAIFAVSFIFYILRFFRPSSSPQRGIVFFCFFYLTFALVILGMCEFRFIRYLIPLHPFLYCLLAWILAETGTPLTNGIKRSLICLWIVLGVFSSATLFSSYHYGQSLKSKGYDFSRIPYKDHCDDFRDCHKHYQAIEESLTEDERRNLRIHFAYEIANNRLDYLSLNSEVNDTMSKLNSEFVADFIYAVGTKTLRMEQSIKTSIEKLSFLNQISEKHYHLALRGILDEYGNQPYFHFNHETSIQGAKEIPEALKTVYWRTQGRLFARKAFQEGKSFQQMLGSIQEPHKETFLIGLGLFIFEAWSQQPFKTHPWLYEAVEQRTVTGRSILEGLGIAYSLYERNTVVQSWKWDDLVRAFSADQIGVIEKARTQNEHAIS